MINNYNELIIKEFNKILKIIMCQIIQNNTKDFL